MDKRIGNGPMPTLIIRIVKTSEALTIRMIVKKLLYNA